MIGTYAKAVAGSLPVVGGRRPRELAGLERTVSGLAAERDALAAYDRVCGFDLRDELPSTYVHVLAFPHALALMTDRRFPFGVLGLVHLRNRIVQRRPLLLQEPFDVHVRAENLAPHERGTTVDVVAEARVDGEAVWEGTSTYLRRGGGGGSSGDKRARRTAEDEPLPVRARWEVPGDVGRRYAGVSGDRNPIHLHPLSAKLFGLPGAIAHGMWLKARCLAALEDTLPDAYAVDVRFKLPLLLPGRVTFGERDGAFEVRGVRDGRPHLAGEVAPAP